jgi:hypothetical protein
VAQVGEAQALFKLITELKLSLLTSNLEGLNAVVDERNAAFATSRDAAIANVKTLEADIDSCLDRLETHYYSSVYR